MNWANESPYGQAVYDSLLQASPSGAIEPHLATAWSYNASKTVLTLTLRSDVKFTDGTAFDASTAAANLEAFQKGTSANAADLVNMESATAASPTKLVITLKQPDPAFLVYLTQNAGLQEEPEGVQQLDGQDHAGRAPVPTSWTPRPPFPAAPTSSPPTPVTGTRRSSTTPRSS